MALHMIVNPADIDETLGMLDSFSERRQASQMEKTQLYLRTSADATIITMQSGKHMQFYFSKMVPIELAMLSLWLEETEVTL